MAIQDAIAEFNVEYTVTRFCQDLTKIRDNTFKKSTIQSAFEKSGIWPINEKKCTEQLKKFVPSQNENNSSSFPTLPRVQPKTVDDVERGLLEWLPKIRDNTQWGDPVREQELEEFVSNTKEVVAKSTLTKFELSLHHERRSNELLQRATSRKRLRPNYSTDGGLGLTKEDAQRAIVERQQKDEQIEKKREHNNFMRIWRMKRDSVHTRGRYYRSKE